MTTDMRKTPSYLKGLAETRARAAGDLQRHAHQKAALETLLSDTEADLVRYQKMHARVSEQLEGAKSDLESCDRLIRKFDGRLDPEGIEPIRAHKGKYGGHGQLRETIQYLLKNCYPEALDTERVALTIGRARVEPRVRHASGKACVGAQLGWPRAQDCGGQRAGGADA